MNILVTGGSGFIGSHIVDHLIDAGHSVRILDIIKPSRNDIEYIEGSILERSILKKTMTDIDVVYHLAGVSNIDYVKEKPIETIEYNVLGTAYLLDEVRHGDIKNIFLASSVFAFEKKGHLYTSSKLYSEILCKNYGLLYGIPYTILRLGTAYGPRSRKLDVISIFVNNALNGKKLIIKGGGTQYRNFIYVKDIAKASVLALDKENLIKKTLIIAGEKSISILELANEIKKIFNGKPHICIDNSGNREDDYIGKIGDTSETFSLLNWKPEFSLSDGLNQYIKWYSDKL